MERKTELRTIADHILSVMHDLIAEGRKLEELRCGAEAKKIDTACGKLYDAVQALTIKANK